MKKYVETEKLKEQLKLEAGLGYVQTLADVEKIIDQQSTVKSVPLYKIFNIIAGHSNYHGDDILTALTCVAEGKEVKNVKPLQQPTSDGWIPVSSGKLPEDLEPVNITWVNRKPESYYNEVKDVPFTATAVLCKGKWWWYSVYCEDYLAEYGKSLGDEMDKDIEVIAWQPLPQPYKESE